MEVLQTDLSAVNDVEWSLVDLWRTSVPVFAKGPPFHFAKGHNEKAPTGRQPLLEFCLATPCNHGLENFCLGYLPKPKWQNLNKIKLQLTAAVAIADLVLPRVHHEEACYVTPLVKKCCHR
ncbi:hypothetical protein TNCV_3770961 [Trichonephila clavipes]|nr:hypothetical protein TNCV_3770961 [Trichonephila clavipes]